MESMRQERCTDRQHCWYLHLGGLGEGAEHRWATGFAEPTHVRGRDGEMASEVLNLKFSWESSVLTLDSQGQRMLPQFPTCGLQGPLCGEKMSLTHTNKLIGTSPRKQGGIWIPGVNFTQLVGIDPIWLWQGCPHGQALHYGGCWGLSRQETKLDRTASHNILASAGMIFGENSGQNDIDTSISRTEGKNLDNAWTSLMLCLILMLNRISNQQ